MARTDSMWEDINGGTAIQTIAPLGYDILINGLNKYLNFNTDVGSSGYGFRDNAGTMEFKNSGGSWTAFGSGGGSQTPWTSDIDGNNKGLSNVGSIQVNHYIDFNNAMYMTALGYQALDISTGYQNTAVGFQTLKKTTTGYNNTALGMIAMLDNTIGYNNTAIGVGAGHNNSVTLQTMSNSVFIGYNSNSSVDGIDNSIAIGANSQVTQKNQVVLGNSSIVQTLLYGYVGINNASPGFELDVTGNINVSSVIQAPTLYALNGGSPVVSIGNTTAVNYINYDGASSFAGGAVTISNAGAVKIADGTQSSGYVLTSDSSGNATWQAPTGGGGSPAGSNGYIQFNESSAFAADSNLFWDNTNKYLGLGTASPASPMELANVLPNLRVTITDNTFGNIYGGIQFGNTSTTPGDYTGEIGSFTFTGNNYSTAGEFVSNMMAFQYFGTAKMAFVNRHSATMEWLINGYTSVSVAMKIDTSKNILLGLNGGNVAIGSTTPGNSIVNITGLPTSSVGLISGDIYQAAGVLMIVP